MFIEDVYLRFKEKVNKNFTNDNFSADKARFVEIYNESQNKYVEWVLEKRNEDDIRDIQKLLVHDKDLGIGKKRLNYYSYSFPDDFFSWSTIRAFADKGRCKNQSLYLFEIKAENRDEMLHDEHNKPSFKYRETFYTIGEDEVKIYADDFKISKSYLTYYRYPKRIAMKGDRNKSVNINPEFDDKVVDRILTICVKDFSTNNENLHRYQVDKDKTLSKP